MILRFTYLEQDSGRTSIDAQEMEHGFYRVGGGYLGLVGRWRIDVVVRRKGVQDSVAHFDWIVPPPGPSRPRLLSDRPLEPLLTVVAALLLLSTSLIVAGVWMRPSIAFGGLRNRGQMVTHTRERESRDERPTTFTASELVFRLRKPPAPRMRSDEVVIPPSFIREHGGEG